MRSEKEIRDSIALHESLIDKEDKAYQEYKEAGDAAGMVAARNMRKHYADGAAMLKWVLTDSRE